MNVLEYASNSAAYLFFVGFILVAINGFAVGGATAGNVLLMLAGTFGAAGYGHTLLTNPVNWYDEIL
jgi:hypothetical protein